MFRQKNRQSGIIVIALAVVFTIGLVLGALALFYVPENVTEEAIEAFGLKENAVFPELFKENLTFELVWMVILWILGSSAVTAPFMSAVMSLRGFVMGFSVSFMIAGELEKTNLFLCRILPQCVTALPVMSAFILSCVIYGEDKGYQGGYQAGYFVRGILFVGVTVLVSVFETWLMILFEKFC